MARRKSAMTKASTGRLAGWNDDKRLSANDAIPFTADLIYLYTFNCLFVLSIGRHFPLWRGKKKKANRSGRQPKGRMNKRKFGIYVTSAGDTFQFDQINFIRSNVSGMDADGDGSTRE